jgi:murein DD-endopeptidase MepM/ murein hydrolase activator NlpD
VASQSGVVAYAGNELRGFGNMLLIKHADGWVTAYAHNEALLVGRGDTVRKGQVIAKVGTSGSVTKPQLHFELRKGKKPVDPLKYLGKGSV